MRDASTIDRVHVSASGAYDVLVGEGLLPQVGRLVREAAPHADSRVLLVSDSNVAPLYADVVCASLREAGFEVALEVLPAGEATKSLESFARLVRRCAACGMSRQSTVVALGGGVIGDLAGFTAASYMRGCNLVQVATSLLAMVDSSVGGKTAVDLPEGKNLVGAFWQPKLVVCDLDCLKTLPAEFVSDGMGEVVKYGIMCDAELFSWLESSLAGQERRVVERCISIKRDVVQADEREAGQRKLLNLGHTAGHSIELLSGYGVTHGHAVAAGTAIMARACAASGQCADEDAERIERMLMVHGLPCGTTRSAHEIAQAALHDKKRVGDQIDVVAVRGIGRCEVQRVDMARFERMMELGCAKQDVVLAEGDARAIGRAAAAAKRGKIATVDPQPLSGTIAAISSKSAAHRMLICAALSQGPCDIRCTTTSKDIEATVSCLRALGACITRHGALIHVDPIARDGLAGAPAELDCCESGSTLRFMLPVVCALGAQTTIGGCGRLPERPLSPLREELEAHGISLSAKGEWPLKSQGKLEGGLFTIPGNVSSQFVTGLLLALPLLEEGGRVRLLGRVESRPYIDMTLRVLAQFGVEVEETHGQVEVNGMLEQVTEFTVAGGLMLQAQGELVVEGDWSNAAFWLCAGALGEAGVTVGGLDFASAQGDKAILDILERFGAVVERDEAAGCACVRPAAGALRAIELDAGDVPDLVPVVSVVAACAQGTTRIYNAARLRIKESDRLETTSEMLERLGIDLEELPDGLSIHGRGAHPGGVFRGARVRSHNDHRLAMSAAVAAAKSSGAVRIEDCQAVNKSYPAFFEDFARLGGRVNVDEMEA